MSNSYFFLICFSTVWKMSRRDWLQVGVGGEPEVPRGLLRVLHVPGEAGGGILRAGGQELLSAVQVSRSYIGTFRDMPSAQPVCRDKAVPRCDKCGLALNGQYFYADQDTGNELCTACHEVSPFICDISECHSQY